jgi:hypothetical protein
MVAVGLGICVSDLLGGVGNLGGDSLRQVHSRLFCEDDCAPASTLLYKVSGGLGGKMTDGSWRQQSHSNRVGNAPAIVLAAGAVAAEALMLVAGHQNTHYEITALFVCWVGSPFALLWAADRASSRWPRLVRTTLSWLMLLVTVVTVAAYTRRVLFPPAAQPAAVFVLVPPVCWVIIATVLGIAFLIAGRSRR